MTAFLQWLEQTSLSITLRDSPNVFLYPTILAFHTLGLAFFVGLSSAIALRILGVAHTLPFAPFRKFYPLMWAGFALNAVSGLLLLVIDPETFLTMSDFYAKLVAIAGAVYCNRLLYLRYFKHPPATDPQPMPVRDRRLAIVILFLWGASITAGRLTAYDDSQAQVHTAIGTLIVSAVLLTGGYMAVKVWRAVSHGVVLKSDVFLQLKLLFVLLAGVNLLLFYVTGMSKAVDRLEAGDEAPPLAKVFAGASLALWIAVMYFARLIPSGTFQP